MKSLKHMFPSLRSHPKHCVERECGNPDCKRIFKPKDSMDHFCSRACLQSYNSPAAHARRHAGMYQPQQHRNAQHTAVARGSPSHQPSHTPTRHVSPYASPRLAPGVSGATRTAHSPAHHATSSQQPPFPPSPMSYGSGSRTGYHASPPRAITPSHCTGSPASSTLRTAGSSRAYTPAAIPHPAIAHPAIAHPAIAHPAIPRHVAAVARTPSEPPQPQVQADPSQHHDAPSRRSSAGHTPGLALRRLPQEEDPPPVSNNDRPPPPERNDRYRTATPRGIVAPTSARPQAMQTGGTVGGRLRPLEAARSPLSAEPTIWQFEPPPTPSAASTSSSSDDEPEPHGGFYDANGYPMRIKFGSDGWVHIPPPSTPPSAGSEMASSATLIQTPPTHAPRQAGGYGGHYLSPDSGPSVTPRARPNAAALRTVPRPRSNSYGL